MREILFRGKRKDNGNWIEGNLFIPDNADTPTQICIGTNIVRTTFYIIPETVGEYTGLTDKNGKKIFEGDIVKGKHEWRSWNTSFGNEEQDFLEQKIRGAYGKHTGENDLGERFYYYRNYVVEYYAPNGRYRLRNGSVFHDLTSGCLLNRNAEVIGNIHNNPELLGGDPNG